MLPPERFSTTAESRNRGAVAARWRRSAFASKRAPPEARFIPLADTTASGDLTHLGLSAAAVAATDVGGVRLSPLRGAISTGFAARDAWGGPFVADMPVQLQRRGGQPERGCAVLDAVVRALEARQVQLKAGLGQHLS
jgi:hypothetical protein